MLLATASVSAATTVTRLKAVPDAQVYEWELADKPDFKTQNIVQQGSSDTPSATIDARGGSFFLRSRPIFKDGRPGPWSELQKVNLGSLALATLRIPSPGQVIEIAAPTVPIYFEWDPIEGATQYELLINAGKAGSGFGLRRKSLSTALSITNLVPGTYSAQVAVLAQGRVLSTSAPVAFVVQQRSLASPQMITPIADEVLRAYVTSPVRWSRKVLGTQSQIELRELNTNDRAVISVERVRQPESWLKPLSPGRYQVTVTDFINDKTNEKSQSTVVFRVEEDPLGRTQRRLGLTFRANGYFNYGWNARANYDINSSNSTVFQKSSKASGGFEFRAQQFVYHQWGVELFYRGSPDQVQPINPTGNERRFEYLASMRALKKVEPLGPTWPLLLKVGLTQQTSIQPLKNLSYETIANNVTNQAKTEPLVYRGLDFGAELRIGGWSSLLDLLLSADLRLPLLMGSSQKLGQGSVKPIPDFQSQMLLRRTLSSDISIFGGAEIVLQSLSNSEEAGSDTKSQKGLMGLKIGFDIFF